MAGWLLRPLYFSSTTYLYDAQALRRSTESVAEPAVGNFSAIRSDIETVRR